MAGTKKTSAISDYYADRDGYRGPYAEYQGLIVSHLQPGMKLLDIGCGRTFPMARKWSATGAEVHGLDPVIDYGSLPPEVQGVRGGAEDIPYPDETFDLIISCAVLEHLEQPEGAFREFSRLLKPNGRVILLTPSKYDYVSLIARLVPNRFHGWLVKNTEGRAEMDTFPTFYRANSRRQITSLAKGTGLSLEQFQYLDQSPYGLKFNSFFYWLGCRYHHLVRSYAPLSFLNGWLLCELAKNGKRAGC